MNLIRIIPLMIVCTFNSFVCAVAQNISSPKITIRSYIQEGDSTKESTAIINFQNGNQVVTFLDSILSSSDQSLKNIQHRISSLGISDTSDLSLDNIFNKLSQSFGQNLTGISSQDNKVVLGVMIDDYNNTNDLRVTHPIISNIISGSPAEEAGLLKNDIIFKLDNEEVNLLPDIIQIIKNKSDGDSLHIQYIRNFDTLQTVAVLKVMKKDENWLSLLQQKMEERLDSCAHKPNNPFCEKIIVQKSGPRLGVKVVDMDAEAKKDLKAKKGGVLITEVIQNSTAESMGLHTNDVITSLNNTQVKTVAELKNVINSLQVPNDIEISYIRYGKKKKAKGAINEFSKAWDENSLMNIIDLSNFFKD